MSTKLPLIKVVGVSASGKSTLVKSLRASGYDARPVSQEHSSVDDLWRQFSFPKVLIYLHTNLEMQRQRRPDVEWDEKAHQDEVEKLQNAVENADLRIDTSGMTAQTVADLALSFLESHKIGHAQEALPPVPQTGSFAK